MWKRTSVPGRVSIRNRLHGGVSTLQCCTAVYNSSTLCSDSADDINGIKGDSISVEWELSVVALDCTLMFTLFWM